MLYILIVILSFSLFLNLIRSGILKKCATVFRIFSIALGVSLFTYWFIEKSIDRLLQNSLSLQIINELPQPLDFYIITPDKKEGDSLYTTEHFGNIRTDHYRLDNLMMKNSSEYWIVGYIGKNIAYFSKQSVPNINIDQVISINNYTIEDDSLAETAKEYIESYKAENMNNAFWVTMGLLLLFLNIGTFIKIK